MPELNDTNMFENLNLTQTYVREIIRTELGFNQVIKVELINKNLNIYLKNGQSFVIPMEEPFINEYSSALMSLVGNLNNNNIVNAYVNSEGLLTVTLANGLEIVSDYSYLNENINKITGNLTDLTTEVKTSLVASINEIVNKTKDILALYDKNVAAGTGKNGWTDLLVQTQNGRTQADKNRDIISVKDFGAKGDGITDDTQALQNWLNALSSKVSGFIPSGNYIFKQTLYKPDATVITGCGSSSMLTYAGTATDIDLLDFGVSSKNTDKWVLQNFLVTSDTKMTSGYAMRFRRFSDTFIDKVIVEGMDLHKFNLYHGYFFDGCHEVWLSHFQAFCQGNGISVCGWNDQSNCDLYLSNGYANFCKNGIVVGGGFGGLFLGNNIELLGNSKTNMTIDQSLNNQSNREVLIDSIGCFDGIWGTPVGLLIDCPDSTAMQILIEGYICSNTEKLIYIKSAPNSHVSIKSSKLFNSKNHGVVIDDPTTKVVIGNGTTISNNVGWAVFATAETKLVYSEAVMHDNGGKYSHNVKNQDWQTYAVNYSATSGNFNYLHVYGRYKIVGGVCHFTVEVVCDDAGTASGAFFIQLPVPPRNFVIAVGRDNGNTGKVVIGNCPNYTGNMMLITTFDNYFPVYNGSRLLLSGSYEYDRTVQ